MHRHALETICIHYKTGKNVSAGARYYSSKNKPLFYSIPFYFGHVPFLAFLCCYSFHYLLPAIFHSTVGFSILLMLDIRSSMATTPVSKIGTVCLTVLISDGSVQVRARLAQRGRSCFVTPTSSFNIYSCFHQRFHLFCYLTYSQRQYANAHIR